MEAHKPPKTVIRRINFMGDSLSDEGTFALRTILYGLVPKSVIADMDKFPHGRFTNGYTWVDLLCELLVSKYLSKDLEERHRLESSDIADGIIDHDPVIEKEVRRENTLDIDTKADSEGERFARYYCEGGLTSHNYGSSFIASLKFWGARKIVCPLENKCNLLLDYDKQFALSDQEKSETLNMEWSGGNDLITVNSRPTEAEADMAVAARIANIKRLYDSGYRNFALCNLPDLACTPRFQNYSQEERDNATAVVNHFNRKLQEECLKFQSANPGASVHVIDTYTKSAEIYNNPEKYGFDESKKRTPFNTSPDYAKKPDGTAPAPRYMYSDDIHPSAELHTLICENILKQLEQFIDFQRPFPTKTTDARNMYHSFMHAYTKQVKLENESIFTLWGWTVSERLPQDALKVHAIEGKEDYLRLLAIILNHGINDNGARTRKILLDFGWIDSKNNIDVSNPALGDARDYMKELDDKLKDNVTL